ncbi:MAG: hypothetical protein COT81_04200 [Candidatus Buchananbacteria bacterium CG10_big_fil_rev_8_21_14_0_10_42_9]|uniref:RecF/RecN/SMC N-terminal domain-containing protein n=1 Tax=Candidatus Buchananbacteria bacterium CG10_big_fil_rev_8_21_14_0_10_42_9 TaxID=1974526 RepID=A0A2H0W2H8_9BACT|nr:MAG: hypothetical protein COT81_04200 [Candidatus Buchananbacteria bacterium CG10_big_fil_rev_8_21_14_0_10_42_9]
MYLKKLEAHGFKSFANKITLEFPKPEKKPGGSHGIAAIVGPNGSGKSNIAEAVRWALGEQSIKALRGKKAEDVIFSGSDKKSRMSMAEVSLYFDNADKQIPIDYHEVVLTRRVYRTGESDYIINKNKTRLSDIQILLAKSNIGQRSYSIIGQGMIDSILIATPTERKEFFDEAVGVKEFQMKRDQSLKKLERTWDNLMQVEAILNEIEPRLRSLTRQVKRLEQREEVERNLRLFQHSYFGALWRQLQKERSELSPDAKKHAEGLKIKQAKLDQISNKLQRLEKADTPSDAIMSLQQEYQKKLESKNKLREEQLILENKIVIAKERVKMETSVMPTAEIISHLEEIEAEHKSFLAIASDKTPLQAIKEKVESIYFKVSNLLKSLKNPKAKAVNGGVDPALEKQKHKIDAELKILEDELSSFQKQIDEASKQQSSDKGAVFDLQREWQVIQRELNSLNAKASDVRVALAKVETRIEDLEREIKEETGSLDWLKNEGSTTPKESELSEIHKLKHQLELIGGIDPETVKEYKEIKERYDFLSGQANDLKKSSNELEQVILDLDDTIHQHFNKAFKTINEEFNKFFRTLFNGGKAELRLIKEEPSNKKTRSIGSGPEAGEDELEDSQAIAVEGDDEANEIKAFIKKIQSGKTIKGIDIITTPPGKKLAGIAMLSGGERAMASIALICAIISNNPSPFVVLDEVDAALDEANSIRYAAILDELSHKTQFITITHNRATMEKATMLYGVSMGEDGVSKLLSIDFEQAEKHVNR